MKLSDKFRNLGQSGLARRVASEPKVSAPIKTTKQLAKALNIAPAKLQSRVKRWREANPELYRERQRAYQAKHKAKKLAEKAKK